MVQIKEERVPVWTVEYDRLAKEPLQEQLEQVYERYHALPEGERQRFGVTPI